MESLSDAFVQPVPGVAPPQAAQLRTRHHPDEEFVNYGRYEGEAGLSDIGLDDMSISKIAIELSTDRTHFKIWSPFNEDYIEDLKRQIPRSARRWDPSDRCWRVDCYWFGNAQALLSKHYPHLDRHYTDRAIRMCEQIANDEEQEERFEEEEKKKKKQKAAARKKARQRTKQRAKKRDTKRRRRYEEEDEPDPPREHPGHEAYKILGISPDAPDEVVKAAHKVLARKYHPDNQAEGNEKKAKEINGAFDLIKELRGWNMK
jgi:hypothetical protein